jgi:hypothetical protein
MGTFNFLFLLIFLPECSGRDELSRMKGVIKGLVDGLFQLLVKGQNDGLVDR